MYGLVARHSCDVILTGSHMSFHLPMLDRRPKQLHHRRIPAKSERSLRHPHEGSRRMGLITRRTIDKHDFLSKLRRIDGADSGVQAAVPLTFRESIRAFIISS